jgi:hypothetical protein
MPLLTFTHQTLFLHGVRTNDASTVRSSAGGKTFGAAPSEVCSPVLGWTPATDGYFTFGYVPTNSPGLMPLQSPLTISLFARLPGKFPHGVSDDVSRTIRKAVYKKRSRPSRAFKRSSSTSILKIKIVDSPEVSHLVGGGAALKGSRAGL